MKARNLVILGLGVVLAASSAVAITPGNDLLIAGAARTATWRSDLLINNPGASSVVVDVYWLYRDTSNTNPAPVSFTIQGEETLVLADVIRDTIGLNRGEGAFRITATGGEVTANLLVYAPNPCSECGGTLGSGFEAIPAAAATAAGDTTFVMGLADGDGVNDNDDVYTNLFALAGSDGVTMTLDLLDTDGDLVDSAQVTLEAFQPWLSFRSDIWNVGSFEGTLRATVSAGSAAILASLIDEASKDPTTLESQFGAAAGSVDGTYQFAVYDSLGFASGGNLVISGGEVFPLNGTYINFDKLDGQGNSECTLIFLFGFGLAATDVADFGAGVEFTDSYPDSGDMTWTLSFTVDDNLGFEGTIDAVGSNFSGADEGCNGSFPTLVIEGGKRN